MNEHRGQSEQLRALTSTMGSWIPRAPCSTSYAAGMTSPVDPGLGTATMTELSLGPSASANALVTQRGDRLEFRLTNSDFGGSVLPRACDWLNPVSFDAPFLSSRNATLTGQARKAELET